MDDMEEIVIDTVTKVFSGEFDQHDLQRAATGEFQREKWRLLEELGLPAALAGGQGSDLAIETTTALKIVGLQAYHAIPLPLAETMFANHMLDRVGLPTHTGPMTIALPKGADKLALERTEAGWRLTGTVRTVPWARHAEAIVAQAAHGNRTYLAVVKPQDWIVRHEALSLTGTPLDNIEFNCQLSTSAVAPLPPDMDEEAMLLVGAILRTIGIAGTLERILALTTGYVMDRVQFGKPLGKLQAIQHSLAQMAEQTVAARAAADLAADTLVGDMSIVSVAAAKSRAGEAAGIAAGLAHQVHGAIGVTEEYLLHRLTKQAYAWRDEFGSETFWNERLGKHFLKAGADDFWPALAAI